MVDHWAWHQHFNSDPELTARLVRVHTAAGIYDAMRALLDPIVLEEEQPNSEPERHLGDVARRPHRPD